MEARVDIDADVRYEGPTRSRGQSGLDEVNLGSIKSMFEKKGAKAPALPTPMFSLGGMGMGLAGSANPSVVAAHDAKSATSFDRTGPKTAGAKLGATGTASLGGKKKETAAQRRRRLKKGNYGGGASVGQQVAGLASMAGGSSLTKAQQGQKPPTQAANL